MRNTYEKGAAELSEPLFCYRRSDYFFLLL